MSWWHTTVAVESGAPTGGKTDLFETGEKNPPKAPEIMNLS